jgi:trans-2,3-dihydro-3-hydroxyanthranilate isomerase
VAGHRFVLVDVFTDRPLQGNQLAVFTDARSIPEQRLQELALEIGFSETVFVYPPEQGGTVRIRIFTPRSELPFAGHPTLGAAFVLGTPLQRQVIEVETGSGIVPVELERDESGRISFGRMVQPVPSIVEVSSTDALFAALGVRGSELPVERYDNGCPHILVTLSSEDEVAGLTPDVAALSRFDAIGVNCFAGSGERWRTRMFSPAEGVGEDAATGSAAGPLACHLARHGLIDWGKEIVISQGSEIGRPSTLYACAYGSDGLIDRVEVGGRAVTVARGEFQIQ